MRLGFLTAMYSNMPLQKVLEMTRPLGLEAVELGTGNFPGDPHAPLQDLLKSKPKRDELLAMLKGEGMILSALSCHGNCLHPDTKYAQKCQQVQTDTIKLAEMLGVKTVIDFSGCPGSDESAKRPSWITCPWPPDYLEALDWQWEKKVIPYWTKQAKFAKEHGVQVAFELHPGFVVYNTETMLKLRKACGSNLGANLDPSHLFWQGMDPIDVVRWGRRSSTCTPRTRWCTSRMPASTACSTRNTTATKSTVRGSSAPAGTGTASSGGRISCPRCAWSVTTTC